MKRTDPGAATTRRPSPGRMVHPQRSPRVRRFLWPGDGGNRRLRPRGRKCRSSMVILQRRNRPYHCQLRLRLMGRLLHRVKQPRKRLECGCRRFRTDQPVQIPHGLEPHGPIVAIPPVDPDRSQPARSRATGLKPDCDRSHLHGLLHQCIDQRQLDRPYRGHPDGLGQPAHRHRSKLHVWPTVLPRADIDALRRRMP